MQSSCFKLKHSLYHLCWRFSKLPKCFRWKQRELHVYATWSGYSVLLADIQFNFQNPNVDCYTHFLLFFLINWVNVCINAIKTKFKLSVVVPSMSEQQHCANIKLIKSESVKKKSVEREQKWLFSIHLVKSGPVQSP